MFDDRHRRAVGRCEFTHQLKGRIGVVDVVVGEFLALQLLGGRHANALGAIGVEGRVLVRVLTIAQRLCNLTGKSAAARCLKANRTGHPV